MKNPQILFLVIAAIVIVVGLAAFGPHAQWKCPAGSGLVDGMCVPGATKPVRE